MLFAGVLSCALVSGVSGGDWAIEEVGRFVLEDGSIRELSGVSWVSTDEAGTRYLCVSDDKPIVIPLIVDVDRESGAIASVVAREPLPLIASADDLEGIGFDPRTGTALISNESEPGIREHDLASGKLLRRVDAGSHPELSPFEGITRNKAWESLAISPDGTAIWTANEDALTDDPAGTIRLQRFDADLKPTGQWAYDLAPQPDEWVAKFALGVPDLLMLPDGNLVVLERGFGTMKHGFRARIQLYQVDLTNATQLEREPLDGAVRVGKTLLWENNYDDLHSNFEGITLGQTLTGGDRTILLVADNGGTTNRHSVLALRLRRNTAPAEDPAAAGQ